MAEGSTPRLAGIALLRSMSEAELQALEQRCRWRRFGAGQQIVDRDSEDRSVFFVVEGRVRVVDYSPGGREVIYAVLGPGSHFGELAAIDGRGRSASVLAVETCVLAAITPADLDSLLRRSAELALALIRHLVEIIRTSDERITELSTLGAMQRVGRELLRLAEPGPSGAFSISPLPTQSNLASQTGTMSRTLAPFTYDGPIERNGRFSLWLWISSQRFACSRST
jgi:CRP/FNR family transcriptional regulator, cyclic AMP receptor protein